jgi:hypothetical protein
VSVDIDAPRDGRATTRVNWLTRQLRDAPDGLRIDAFTAGSRGSTSELLKTVREHPTVLVDDPKRDFRMFRVAATSPVGSKRGTGRGGFIDSVLAAIDGFYEAVVQQVRPWAPKAPQLPSTGRTAAEEAGIDIEPPEQDLLEPTDSVVTGQPPPDAAPPAVVEAGASDADERGGDVAAVGEEDDATPQPGELSLARREIDHEELLSWDAAHERLDHERSLDEP